MVTWSEAFTIFTLILTSYFPHHWKDLTSYKRLILRTYCQFSGHVWQANDQAFCQHAAVMKLVDWSTMNIQLYNFHAAGASVHSGSGGSLSELPEPSEADSSQVICWLWNRGCCSAQFASCRFANHRSVCAGSYCASECSPRFNWQNILIRSQGQIFFSTLRTLVRLEIQALVDAPFVILCSSRKYPDPHHRGNFT